jgi:cell filamentation protein
MEVDKWVEDIQCKPISWADGSIVERFPDLVATIKEIEVAADFKEQQFYKCTYMDNLYENTLPPGLTQKKAYRIISSKINTLTCFADIDGLKSNEYITNLADIGRFELTELWEADGRKGCFRQILQHFSVLRVVWQHGQNGAYEFDIDFLLNIHRHLMNGAYELNGEAMKLLRVGEIRTCSVHAGSHQFENPQNIKPLLVKLIDRMNRVEAISEIMDIFRSFLLIHPFQNGNGRTARILLNWLLARYKLSPVPIVLTSGHYKARKHYLSSLKNYNKGKKHELNYLLLASLYGVYTNLVSK